MGITVGPVTPNPFSLIPGTYFIPLLSGFPFPSFFHLNFLTVIFMLIGNAWIHLCFSLLAVTLD